jgi:5-methylcytosine-specific restriction endonuclease McrA
MAFDECPHDIAAVRRRNAAHGEIFAKQCLACGARVGQWLKRDVARALGGVLEAWDETLARAWSDRLLAREREARAAEEKAWQARYRAYLRSEAWARRRARVLARARERCEGCGEAKAAAVHHLTYAHLGAEFLWELVALCDPCHARVHGWKQKTETR